MAALGWGILAPGKISRSFATDLRLLPDHEVVAVGSRTQERAAEFAATYGGTPYGSYAELVADPRVDVVYVGSPHSLHREHTELALEAGKHVLCEKPVALTAADAAAMYGGARARGLFLMEAMWTACHPRIRALLDRLDSGEHGTVRQVVADLGFRVEAPPESRLLDPRLGAGALLDVGIYPLTFAQLVLGDPEEQRAVGTLVGGIDHDIAIAASYAGGATAALTASMSAPTSRSASVSTELGRFDLVADFHHPPAITWTPYDAGRAGPAVELEPGEPVIGRGYGNEAVEVARCLAAGRTTSDLVPPDQTLAVMRQMDAIRAQLGVHYPSERSSDTWGQ